MRVLQIVPSISLIYGGPSQMALGLSEALAAQGVEVTILTTDSNGDNGQAPLDVPLDRPVEQNGYEIRYFRCSPFKRYKFSIPLFQWLNEHAHEYDIAHIHALFSPVSSIAASICRRNKLPYILRPLGTLDPADLKKKAQIKKLYAAALEKPNLAGAAAVHFTSPQECEVSERFGTDPKSIIMPLGVKLPKLENPEAATQAIREELKLPSDKPILLFLSRIDPKKGLDLLFPALEQLKAEGLAFHLVLAGGNPQDPDYEQGVHQKIAASRLKDCTTIPGFVRGDRKLALLAASDCFVLPSYYENFGIAVAEAMAAKLPVMISDQVHIFNDIAAAEAGWICQCNVESVRDQLRAAIKDAGERQVRGENAQRCAAAKYSWSAIAARLNDIYGELSGQVNEQPSTLGSDAATGFV